MNRSIIDTAQKLSIPPEWLDRLIKFESGYKPDVVNPYTKAAGLIQFMPNTAKGLGFADQFDLIRKHPTIDSQVIGPVYKYLKNYAPYPSEQSLYMAVFYPAFRTVPPDTVFPEYVRKVNPGISTVRDYIRKVNPKFPPSTLAIIPLAIAAAVLYFMVRT